MQQLIISMLPSLLSFSS
ncbi:hypothetical protein LINPERHAP1_LOCUS22175 [Linum perenne]